MAAQILFKRGNTAQNDVYTGPLGSVSIDTQLRQIRVHDGVTAGGYALATDGDLDALAATVAGLGIADISGLQSALDGKLDDSQAGTANGLATLDAGGKVPVSQLPDTVVGAMEYQGVWDANTNTPDIDAGATKGDYYKVSVAGSTLLDGETDWKVGDWVVYNATAWDKIDNTDSVSSVAGKTGAVTLVKADVGLGNVDNTSDANKPVSTATQSALDTKAPLASPNLSGTPTAPTAATSTNTTQIATTAFVQQELGTIDSGVTSVAGKTGAVTLVKADVGLGNVDNFATATSLDATNATSDADFMTPLKTKELIEGADYTVDLGTF